MVEKTPSNPIPDTTYGSWLLLQPPAWPNTAALQDPVPSRSIPYWNKVEKKKRKSEIRTSSPSIAVRSRITIRSPSPNGTSPTAVKCELPSSCETEAEAHAALVVRLNNREPRSASSWANNSKFRSNPLRSFRFTS